MQVLGTRQWPARTRQVLTLARQRGQLEGRFEWSRRRLHLRWLVTLAALCRAALIPNATLLPQRAWLPMSLGKQRRPQSSLLSLQRRHVAGANVRAPLPRGPLRVRQAAQPPRQRDERQLTLAGVDSQLAEPGDLRLVRARAWARGLGWGWVGCWVLGVGCWVSG